MRSRLASPVLLLLLACAGAAGCWSRSPEDSLRSGDRFMASGKYREAAIEYANAVKGDPKSGAAQAKLADALLNAGDPPGAMRAYVAAADLLPDDIALQIKAGQSLLLARRYEDARARAERVLAVDSRNIAAHVLKGNATARIQGLDAAIDDIHQAIQIDPNSARTYGALGVLEMNKGRREEAEAAFRRAVDVRPDSATAQLALANFYWFTGRRDEARDPLKKAVTLEPRNVTAQRALAFLYMSSGDLAAAEAPLRQVADGVKDAASRLMLADYYVAAKRPDRAVPLLEALAEEQGAMVPATLRLAAYARTQNRNADADRALARVLAREPAHAGALILKARFLQADGRHTEALATARAAIAGAPRDPSTHFIRGTIEMRAGNVDEAIAAFTEVTRLNARIAAATLQLAQLYLQKGDVAAAIRFAEDARRAHPDDPTTRLVLSRALVASGDLVRAEPILKALVAEHSNAALAHLQLAELYTRKQDRRAARTEAGRAYALAPEAVETLKGLVRVELADRNATRARELVEERLTRAPTDPELLLLAADVEAAAANWTRLEFALRRVVVADPDNQGAFIRLAALYGAQRRLEEARIEYERLWKQQPSSIAAPTMVGMILEAQGKAAEAAQVYEAVLHLDPRAVLAANNLAWLYANHGGNLDVALQLAQTAKAQAPRLAHINDTLGWIYYKKNLATLAIPALEAAVSGAPKSPTYRYHLGLAYAQAGKNQDALRALEEALKLRPDFPDAQATRAALATRVSGASSGRP